jgi:hypothetical protein
MFPPADNSIPELKRPPRLNLLFGEKKEPPSGEKAAATNSPLQKTERAVGDSTPGSFLG